MKIRCLYDKMVKVGDLKPHPKNRNNHPDEQIQRLAQILEYQGFRYPIKVSKASGFITSGHGRLMAAKKLGMKEVPVNFQEYESEEQEYADIVADNSIASWSELDFSGINADIGDLGPDFDIDLLGIKNFEIEVSDKEGLTDADAIPEKVEPKTKRGDIYRLGNHRLMCGDSTSADDFAALMGGETAELCFTSPPYADQREYNGGKELSTEHLATFIRTAFGSCRYFAVNLGYSRKDGEVNAYWDDYFNEARNCGLKFLSWNIWNRSGMGGSVGQLTAMFPIEHEWIFVFGSGTKKLNPTVPNKTAGRKDSGSTIRAASGKTQRAKETEVRSHREIGTVYTCDALKSRDGIEHPARFPVEFPEGYIEAMTSVGDAVYEPFTGSGTTIIAAEKLNRACFGMELDPRYVDIAVARWEQFTGQKAELLNG